MKDKEEKRSLLFGAVWSLLEQGLDPSVITIAQVAQKAGIGKGTVYEYFTSKEELFAQAIATSWMQQVEQMERVDQTLRFQPRFYAIFAQVEQCLSRQRSLLAMMLERFNNAVGHNTGFSDSLLTLRNQLFGRLIVLLRSLYEQGVEEGILHPGATDLDLIFAAISIATIFRLWPQAGMQECPFAYDTQRLDFCYQKFCKLL